MVSGQQQPGRSQQMRSQQQAAPGGHQLPGIPPAATSQAQIPGMQAARQQQPMVQAHMANMGRGTGPSLAGAPSHPMPQGPIKQEGLHPGGLQGQHTMRAASPPMRAMSPAMPGGLTQAQLLQNQHQQQQQAALLHGQQMPGMQLSNCEWWTIQHAPCIQHLSDRWYSAQHLTILMLHTGSIGFCTGHCDNHVYSCNLDKDISAMIAVTNTTAAL